jgi:hypothetical protein
LTGVIFQPSRIAGDSYQLRAYFGKPSDLDRLGNLSAPINASTGTLTVWRKVRIARLIKKKASVPNFDIRAVQRFYDKAYMELDASGVSMETMTAADYDAEFGRQWNASVVQNSDMDHMSEVWVDRSQGFSQWATSDAAVTFRNYNDFQRALHAKRKEYFITHNHLSPADAEAAATTFVQNFIAHTPFVATAQNHATYTNNEIGSPVAMAMAAHWRDDAHDGLTLLAVLMFSSLTPPGFIGTSGINLMDGWAVAGGDRHHKAFILGATQANKPRVPNYAEEVLAHEIGHHLFLVHAADGNAEGPDSAAHDAADHHCTMSYAQQAGHFCGLCNLRLRGWNHQTLSSNGSSNST